MLDPPDPASKFAPDANGHYLSSSPCYSIRGQAPDSLSLACGQAFNGRATQAARLCQSQAIKIPRRAVTRRGSMPKHTRGAVNGLSSLTIGAGHGREDKASAMGKGYERPACSPHVWICSIAQAVAHKVESKHGSDDEQARSEQPRIVRY